MINYLRKVTKYCLLVVFLIFIGCKNENHSVKNQELKVNNLKKKLSYEKFYTLENDSLQLTIPFNWKFEKSNDVWLYLSCSETNKKLYFSVSKYKKTEVGMDLKEYVIEGFKQISSKIDKFKYVLKKLDFEDGGFCFILTTFTSEIDNQYVTYSLIYESNNTIYDFAFKTLNVKEINELNYREFLLIIQSFQFNNEQIINDANFLVTKESKLKYEDLVSEF